MNIERLRKQRPNRLNRSSLLLAILITLLTVDTAYEKESNEPVRGPGQYRIVSEDRVIRFPFELFRGDIRFLGEINGRQVRLLLDDGFMWDQLLFWGCPRVDSLGLVYDGEIMVGGGGGNADQVPSMTASDITLKFPGVEFSDQSAVVTPYSSGMSRMWVGCEGQVSATFFKHFVVDINFDNMMITLIEPDRFEYKGKGVALPLSPIGRGPSSIPAKLTLADGRTVSVELMLDLGYSNQLKISPGLKNNITRPEKALPGSLGYGVQGETLGHHGRVPSVDIGGYTFSNVVAAFVSEDHPGDTHCEVMIGMGLLSRFNIVYDYPHQMMYLEPNHRFNDPFEHNMSGLSMRKGQGDYLDVKRVHPNSPASDAGLKEGDRVTHINGRMAIDYDVWELIPLFRQEGRTVDLTLIRGDKQIDVSIILRRLI